jgi:hypothetical protein
MRVECREARSRLDGCLSDELPPQQRTSVEHHVAGCPACAAELDRRRRVRQELAAVLDVGEVHALEGRVLAAVRREQQASVRNRRLGWLAAAAASLAVVLVAVRLVPVGGAPSEAEAAVIEGARKAHLACAVKAKYSAPLPLEKVPERLDGYARLGAAIQPELSEGATLLHAHVCSWPRHYGHVILQRGGHRVSVLVTDRPAGPAPKTGIRSREAGGFRLGEAESGNYTAFVVSDLEAPEVGALSARILPRVLAALRSGPE